MNGARRIRIDGVLYASLSEASRKTGVDISVVYRRGKNKNFPNYELVDPPTDKPWSWKGGAKGPSIEGSE
jgi:hypothetical protein